MPSWLTILIATPTIEILRHQTLPRLAKTPHLPAGPSRDDDGRTTRMNMTTKMTRTMKMNERNGVAPPLAAPGLNGVEHAHRSGN